MEDTLWQSGQRIKFFRNRKGITQKQLENRRSGWRNLSASG